MVGTFLLAYWSRTKGEGPGILTEARPVDEEAKWGWRSGQNCSALQAEKQFWEPQEVAMGSRLPFCPKMIFDIFWKILNIEKLYDILIVPNKLNKQK